MNGKVPLLGEMEAQRQMMGQNLFLSIYVPLVPNLAVFRLAHGYECEGGITDPATPERIAAEAEEIVLAAYRQIGIAMKKA